MYCIIDIINTTFNNNKYEFLFWHRSNIWNISKS